MKKKLSLLTCLAITFITQAQNVGIGTTAPLSKLHISFGASGNISPFSPLVVEGNNNTYINLLTPNINESGLLFGKTDNAASGGILYNNAGTLNGLQFRTNGNLTRMVIANNGNVGVGNNNPAYQFDLSNRMRIRSGGNNTVSAGLWLNNNANSEAAFIGMEDDTHVGFFGIGAGWKFAMNTQTGAVKINGNEGQVGQVLQSNGNSGAAAWTNYAKPQLVLGNGDLVGPTPQNGTPMDIPGLVATITLTSPARVLFYVTTVLSTITCFGCATEYTYVKIIPVAGGGTGYNTEHLVVSLSGEREGVNAGPMIVDLPAGNHTYKVVLQDSPAFGSNAGVYKQFGTISTLMWQIYPQ